MEGAYLQLEDAAITLRDYASRIESDPAALQQIDDRLDQIGRLKKKYAPTVEEILAYKAESTPNWNNCTAESRADTIWKPSGTELEMS